MHIALSPAPRPPPTRAQAGKKSREAKRRLVGDALTVKEDELEVNNRRRVAKAAADKKYNDLIKSSMLRGDKREKIISQDLLRAEMQMAYKRGTPLCVCAYFYLSYLSVCLCISLTSLVMLSEHTT